MEQLFQQIPKLWLGMGAVAVALVLVVFLKPQHSPCDSQVEVFMKSQQVEVSGRQTSDEKFKSRFLGTADACKAENTAGACEPFMQKLRKLMRDMDVVPTECMQTLGETSDIKMATTEALRLMVQLAWGGQVPVSSGDRVGWFEPYDLVLFCKLRTRVVEMQGQSKLRSLLEELRLKLTGADTLTNDEVWQKSLLSLDCNQFQG